MEKEEDALHFASCRELSYIDYHQGAVQKQQSIAIEVMTPLYLDGARVSTLISSPEDVDILAAGYCLAEGKVASGRG
ncbi:MAG: fatty-acid co-A racemase, partial [Megasphaera sp.]|nr:fatty-acid co-A racemase [Megasphaera sp.]